MTYYERIHKLTTGGGFVRLFYGVCPTCGKRIFSVEEEHIVEKQQIVAKFICPCGKKYKQTMIDFSKPSPRYKYPQALAELIRINGKVTPVLKCENKYFLTSPTKIMSKPVK